MGSSVNIALPSIGLEFGLPPVTLSWVATSYILAAAMFLVPFGRLADIHGRKRVFTCGISLFTLASLLVTTSGSVAALIAFRVLQGIGSAMVFGTGMAILTAVFPPGERGKVLGINVAAVYSGLSVGPFLGGFLTQHFGWRSVFLSALPLGVLILASICLRLKGEWAEARGERYDLPGAILYGLTLVTIMYGFSLLPSWRGGAWILAGGAGLGLFVLWESRVPRPVLDIRHFRTNRVFAMSNLAALINYSATSAVGFLLSLYLQYTRGYSPQTAGLVMISQPIVQTLLSPFAGRLSDRIEPRAVASIGMGFAAAGLALLAFVGQRTPLGYIVGSQVFLGVGFALFSSPNANAVMSSVERRFYGVASGILGTMRLTGNMLSMGIVMLIFSVYLRGARMDAGSLVPFLHSARTAFVVFGALCCAGILASMARGKVRESPRVA
jgi:EmrB/QacA subfamily drug resistance transporter